MVLLQLVEPPAFVLRGVDVVQRIVHQIVGHVPDRQEGPEKGKQGRVSDGQELCDQRENDGRLHHEQHWGMDQSITKSIKRYGSLGSM